jgi:sporulation protein YlmC with PRC-barrel domain
MRLRTAASLTALALALGSPAAIAQTGQVQKAPKAEAEKAPVAGQILAQDSNTILASKDLIGQTVYAADKTKVGSISDLILSKDGKSVNGFVIGVGGLLGLGEKNVALKMDKLKISAGPNGTQQLSMDVSKDELSKAPTFKSTRDMESEKRSQQMRAQPPAQPPGAPRSH